MSGAAPEKRTQSEDSLDKSIRVYREMGFPDARVAELMIRSGFPAASVQQRFPNIALGSLAKPQPPQSTDVASPSPSSPSLPLTRRSTQRPKPTLVAQSDGLRATLNRLATPREPAGDSTIPASPATEGLAFQYVPLIQCTFPHGDPGEQTVFTRRNGRLELTLATARPDAGLPYGVPARLLTIYCASQVKRNKSAQIDLGSSVHEFLRRLDIPITRGERGSLRVYTNQMMRLIHCAISVDENICDESGRQGLHIRQTLLVDEARLWWDEGVGVGRGSYLVLSPAIFDSILTRSAPLSTRAIRALRKSPMDLDVYAWLVHRLYRLGEPSTVSWKQLFGQFGHSYGEIRYFRRFFCGSLTKALQAYPQARVKVSDTGLLLLPSKPHVEPRGDGQA